MWTIGFMSGTSIDAVDAAIIRTDGEKVYEFGPVSERKFTPDERAEISAAVDAARTWNWEGTPPQSTFDAAMRVLNRAHKDAFDDAVAQCVPDKKPVLAGVHGQTVLHKAPLNGSKGRTLQILDAPSLKHMFGVPLAFDFRADDVDAGGEGAPLAPVYHLALIADLEQPVAVLNLGGVANLTYINGDEIFGFDCGPANGPVDEWVMKHHQGTYDADGHAARQGEVHAERLADWMSHPYFKRSYPKSLDRYDFNADLADGLSFNDGCATLTAFSAAGVASGLSLFPKPVTKVVVCGGGRLNPFLMDELNQRCPVPVVTAEDEGWRGDSIEAEAFALLAVRSKRGLPLSFPGTTGVPHPLTGGKLIE
ncbi:MAG: anhydro-N-acetylmuramic acid kinase [Ponticaulis sp.]|nr:anhydro-N-acetylmuramic acid kinase [Ponticaulis sp.]